MNDEFPNIVASIDQQGATWRNMAAMFGRYRASLLVHGIPDALADRITLDLARTYHEHLMDYE